MARAILRGFASRQLLAEPDARLGLMIVAASFPGAIIGFVFDSRIEGYFHVEDATTPALATIAIALMTMGILLAVAERVAARRREMKEVRFRDAMIIGLAQSVALIPGVSRSGSTITTGLFLGLTRPAAARFSFLLSLPITFGAALKKTLDLIQGGGLAASERLPFAIGILTAGLVGYACVAWLLRYLQRASTMVFSVYRVLLGLTILLLLVVR